MNYKIEKIKAEYNQGIEAVIRSCLVEFGADHEGTAWTDPMLGRFSELYKEAGSEYWVAVDEAGQVIGGVGVGPLPGAPGVCELQKMYCRTSARGTGVAGKLLDQALAYAAENYDQVYLETFESMIAAQKFYQKHGFKQIPDRMGDTGHYACDIFYLKELN